jgi:predicted lipid-binding transport protein (Tim44 family)
VNDEQLTRGLRALERIENHVSAALAAAAAGLYVWYRYQHGLIAIYSWTIPFLLVGGASKLAFAFAEARLAQQLRAGREAPALPEARVVASSSPRAAAQAPTVAPPPQPAPPAPGQGPSLLK